MNMIAGALFKLGAAVLLIIILGLLISWPMSWLWNSCLVPAVTGLREVGVVQMWGIIILCGVLFKSNNNNG